MTSSTQSPPFSFTYRMSRKIENSTDLESRLQQCESKIKPMTRSEARERIRYETKVCIKLRTQQQNGGGGGAPIQRRPTPLNDPLIRDRLIDRSELEDKMIALDFRLKMDRCLQEKSHNDDTLATTTFYSRRGVLTGWDQTDACARDNHCYSFVPATPALPISKRRTYIRWWMLHLLLTMRLTTMLVLLYIHRYFWIWDYF